MRGHRIEPLVHRALQLGLRLGEQLAHGLDAGAEFDDPLVGELRRGGLFGGKPRGVRDRRPGCAGG